MAVEHVSPINVLCLAHIVLAFVCLIVCFKWSQYLRVRYFTNESNIWFFAWKVKRSGNSGPNSNMLWQLFIKAKWWLPLTNKYVLSTEPQSPPLGPILQAVATWPLQAFMLWSLVEVLPWLARSYTLISSREISAPIDFHVKKTDSYDKSVLVELNAH